MYTASSAFLESLVEAGVSCIFANFGSDHPALIEAIAEARANGRPLPNIYTAPFEMVGMHAAQGFAQVTGRAQAVVVHVECGTQSLAGAVHNAARGRTPMLIFAGLSPFTQEGEMKGSRNEFIQWIQDTYDQRGLVREYMRYNNEFRTGANIKQITHRSLQFAHSAPQGPVYLVGAREVMEEEVEPKSTVIAHWKPVAPAALSPSSVDTIASALANASRPLIVTSFVGRNPEAVAPLVALCEQVGIGVLESVPSAMNFPHDNPLYLGSHWNHPYQNEALAQADAILVLDSDVPWIPTINRPNPDAQIFHIDVDPLKATFPLWYIPSIQSHFADAQTALTQIGAAIEGRAQDEALYRKRRAFFEDFHSRRAAALRAAEAPQETLSTEYVMARLRPHLDDAIILNEGITNYAKVADHLAPTQPGSMFASGGGSLGWAGGAAIGVKLAAPDKTVVAVSGDGCFMFSVPSTVHWMSRRYSAPYLHIVLNNGGWRAPRVSALSIHPDGYAARAKNLDISFNLAPNYGAIAEAAGGAFSRTLKHVEDVDAAISDVLNAVRVERRSAVLDVWLPTDE
jgi:acetolactate synthase-1/2/3 large subunit